MKYNFVLKFLNDANNIEDDAERAVFMKKYINIISSKVLACFFNPEIEFYRPGKLKYKSIFPYGTSDTRLSVEINRRLHIFLKNNNIAKERKNKILIQILEGLPKEEADFLYINLLPQKNPFKNIGKVFIRNNFPEILNLNIV